VADRGCDRSRSSEARRRFEVCWMSTLPSPIHSALSFAHRRDSRRSSWALLGRGSRPFPAISKAAPDLGIAWISASPVLAPFAGGGEAAILGEERLLVTLLCTWFRSVVSGRPGHRRMVARYLFKKPESLPIFLLCQINFC
jgi:hypothetical protein